MAVERDVTCLIGKNESGKTTVLKALHRVEAACREAGAEEEDIETLAEYKDQASVVAAAREMARTLSAARGKAASRVPAALAKYEALLTEGLSEEQEQAVLDLLPSFFYFSDYELLKGECDLNELAERVKTGALNEGDETILSLLRLAGEGPDDFLEEEYDSRKAELQASSIELSQQVFKYWTQNDALTVNFDTDMPVVGTDPQTQQEIRHRILKIELRDDRHGVETNFSTRSAGFQWFFSFLAAFSAYQDSPERVVVLLDEPGTSLHGEAQGDFLRYIFGELGQNQQVLYTTHSQHMIDPTRYETMRAVHDQATREHPERGLS